MKSLVKADRAHKIFEELKSLKTSALEMFYKMGQLVKEVRDDEHWNTLGYDSFNAYLSDPEIAIPTSTAYHAIAIVETFPKYEEIEGITVRNAIKILSPIKKDKADRQELVSMARSLSSSDLEHELAIKEVIDHNSNAKQLPKIYACDTCEGVRGVYWRDLCHCGMSKEDIKLVSDLIKNIYDKHVD